MIEDRNAPAWRSIADFLTAEFVRAELQRRAAPACDSEARAARAGGAAALSGGPDGNHGENVK